MLVTEASSQSVLALTLAAQWQGPALWFGTVFLAVVCVALILTILIQRPQGGGLTAAFGASTGSGQTAFGAKTGDFLTILTITMFVVFVLLAIALNFLARPIQPSRPLPVGAGGATEAEITDESGAPAEGPEDTGFEGVPDDAQDLRPAQPEPDPVDEPFDAERPASQVPAAGQPEADGPAEDEPSGDGSAAGSVGPAVDEPDANP